MTEDMEMILDYLEEQLEEKGGTDDWTASNKRFELI